MLKVIVKYSFCWAFFTILLIGCGGGGSGGGGNEPGDATDVSLTFSCEPSDVAYNGDVTLNWESTNAESCTASGDWEGEKALSGSETMVSLTKDASFTLNCKGTGGEKTEMVTVTVNTVNKGTATLSWTPPEKNTDGSDLTDLAGYKIYMGTISQDYSQTITVNDASATSFEVKDLAPGTWFFAIAARNVSGNESAKSNEGSKTIEP